MGNSCQPGTRCSKIIPNGMEWLRARSSTRTSGKNDETTKPRSGRYRPKRSSTISVNPGVLSSISKNPCLWYRDNTFSSVGRCGNCARRDVEMATPLERGSWQTRASLSPLRRTSNSKPSHPCSRARSNAATVFSGIEGADRDPRCPSRRGPPMGKILPGRSRATHRASRLPVARVRRSAGCVHINLHRLRDPQQEGAGILDPPLHIGNGEVKIHDPVIGGSLNPRRESDFVIAAVDREDPMHLHRGGTRGGDFALHPIGTEGDLGIARGLQNFAVHAPVANAAATLPRGCIHDDESMNGAGIRIEIDFPALQTEGTVNGVQAVTDGECDGGIDGRKMQRPGRGLGPCHRTHQQAQCCESKPRPYAGSSRLAERKAHQSLLRW